MLGTSSTFSILNRSILSTGLRRSQGTRFGFRLRHNRKFSIPTTLTPTTTVSLLLSPELMSTSVLYRRPLLPWRSTSSSSWTKTACGLLLLCTATTVSGDDNNHKRPFFSTFLTTTKCQEAEEKEKQDATTTTLRILPFEDSVLSYDHYNGVTLYLGEYLNKIQSSQQQEQNQRIEDAVVTHDRVGPLSVVETVSTFREQLDTAVQFWKAEGRKGIWIHVPPLASHWIPDCIQAGFQFHKVLRQEEEHNGASLGGGAGAGNSDDKYFKPNSNDQGDATTAPLVESVTAATTSTPTTLVLSQWLPDTPSKLPLGPSHQVGVGIVVLNPNNPSQMLCVQEKSGPAAAYQLWKMPTGLLDPGEDIPDAAVRELWEETGLQGQLQGIICFRQAHRPGNNSDLFFVCHMALNDTNNIEWKAQEEEIADIQWMSVQDFCDQDRWQGSPLYTKLNDCILQVSKAADIATQSEQHLLTLSEAGKQHRLPMIEHLQLSVGFGPKGSTNALFLPPST